MILIIFLVFLTLALSITVEVLRSRRKYASNQIQSSKALAPQVASMAERFMHPGHGWVKVMTPRQAVVGVDEVAQSFIGRIEGVLIPEVGKRVRQGEPLVTLRRGERAITVVSPLSGIVRDVNSRLRADPALVNESPLDRGWIARIDPENLELESRNLLRGPLAVRWKESVLAQFQIFFSPRLGTVLQDGGRIIGNLGETLGDEAWESLAQELFPLHSSRQTETKPSQGIKP
jgi:glycine cleavage system H protein